MSTSRSWRYWFAAVDKNSAIGMVPPDLNNIINLQPSYLNKLSPSFLNHPLIKSAMTFDHEFLIYYPFFIHCVKRQEDNSFKLFRLPNTIKSSPPGNRKCEENCVAMAELLFKQKFHVIKAAHDDHESLIRTTMMAD